MGRTCLHQQIDTKLLIAIKIVITKLPYIFCRPFNDLCLITIPQLYVTSVQSLFISFCLLHTNIIHFTICVWNSNSQINLFLSVYHLRKERTCFGFLYFFYACRICMCLSFPQSFFYIRSFSTFKYRFLIFFLMSLIIKIRMCTMFNSYVIILVPEILTILILI